jgi:hypothetical protein
LNSLPAYSATNLPLASVARQHGTLICCAALLAVLLLNPRFSYADGINDPLALPEDWQGFYLGAGLGYANVYSWEDNDDDDDDYNFDTDYGDGDLGYVVSSGYRFNPYLAAEVAYTDSGTLDWDDSNIFVDDLGGIYDVDARIDVTSYQLSALGILPFFEVWEIYVRGGLAIWDAESDQTLSPQLGGATVRRQIDEDGVDILLGLGAGRTFAERWHMRVEYNTYRIDDDLMELQSGDDANTDMWSLQLLYRFGVHPAGIVGGDRIEKPDDS